MQRIGCVVGWDLPRSVPAHRVLKIQQDGVLSPINLWASNIASQASQDVLRRHFEAGTFLKQVQRDGKRWRYAVVKHIVIESVPPTAEEKVIAYITIDAEQLVSVTEFSIDGSVKTETLPAIQPTVVGVALAAYMRYHFCPPLRQAGGSYFIPQHKSSLLDTIRSVIDTVQGHLTIFYVAGEPVEQASLLQPVAQMFEEMVAQLRETIATLKRSQSLESVAGKVGELVQEARVYADVLNLYSDELRKQLETAEKALYQALEERRQALGGATK
jgi:hypothetical protein